MNEKIAQGDSSALIRRKKSFQGHQYRRKIKPTTDQYSAELTRVLGFTVKSGSAFACDETSGNIAYPAGCIVVVCQTRQRKQFHIFNPGHKNLTCLQFSYDGKNIVTGESGHLPCVRVFSVQERCQVAFFQSHKFGVSCVAFSPNSQYIVSIGYQHDNVINVWSWKKNILAASNKVSIKVRSVAFAENSRYFVTVGNRHVKFWYIDHSEATETSTVPLKGRSGILGSVRNHLFCDVACGVGCDDGFTFALTRSGMLCQFNHKRTLEKFIQIQTSAAFCMCVVSGMIICGCSASKVLLYSTTDLQLITFFNSCDSNDMGSQDLVAVSMDTKNRWLHCVHADHSLHVWDLLDFNNPAEYHACSFHSECVWDVQISSSNTDEHCSFFTCSNDVTVREWNLTQDYDCVLSSEIHIDVESPASTADKSSKTGVRSLCISEDGKRIAIGDRSGVIHVYEIPLQKYNEKVKIRLHDGDILGMDYSTSNMLVSASRDRCIHMMSSDHEPSYTINDHSAAVTAVKFVRYCEKLRLISCGVDKSLYFCTVNERDGHIEVVRDQHIVEKHAMHDMAIINDTVLVACGCGLREYDLENGKNQRFIRGSETSSTILRVATDSDGSLIAVSCADKFVYVLGYQTGECFLEIGGHSEVCTALQFSSFNSECILISASADSCIFVWTLKRCMKSDYAIPEYTLNSLSDTENDCNQNIPDGLNLTTYFGPQPLNASFLEENCHNMIPGATELSEEEQDSEDMQSELLGTIVNGHDTSLPTWITGKKDRVSRNHVPSGKWAGRFQGKDHIIPFDQQYKDIIMLDTPRSTSEWEIGRVEETEEVEIDNVENDQLLDENLDKNERESSGESPDEQTHVEQREETNAVPAKGDVSCSDARKNSEEEDFGGLLSRSSSTNYASACEESCDESEIRKPDICESKTQNEVVSEPSRSVNEVLLNKSEAPCQGAAYEKPIPPAFADFLEKSKRKQRPPAVLPVEKLYNFVPDNVGNEMEVGGESLQNATESSVAQTEGRNCQDEAAEVSPEKCQGVVDNLLTAYEQAETLYQQVRTDEERRPCGGSADAQLLLSNTFASLQQRITQLQAGLTQDLNNSPPVLLLLREYSDKLFSMVRDEFQKNAFLNK